MSPADDRASTLLLFPAALLIVVVLAAVTVDLARLHLARRDLDDLAAAIGNDVTTLGIDETELRRTGAYRLDPALVGALVTSAARTRRSDLLEGVRTDTELVDDRTVRLRLRANVALPFTRALPGGRSRVTVDADATATAHLR